MRFDLAGLRDAVAGAAGFLMSVLADEPDPWSHPSFGEPGGGVGVGGGPTSAGISVTSTRALNHSTFYACLKIISETFARVPAIPYVEISPDDRERDRTSPYYEALIVRPNRWQTPYWFQQTWAVHKLMAGNFVGEIVQAGIGGEYELVPIHPQRLQILEPLDDTSGPTYLTWSKQGKPRTLLRDEVLHDPMMSGEGWKGMSVLQAAREALGIGMATTEFQAKFFTKGLTQRGVLQHPKHFSPKARKELEEDAQGGLWAANGVLMLQEGVTFANITVSPREAQLLELAEFNVATIARFFGMNHAKLGFAKEGFSYASVEQFILDFISSTMDPYFCSAEQELNRTFIVRERAFAEFLRQALVQADIKTRWMAYAIGLTNQVFTPNDVRRLENLPQREGGDQPVEKKTVGVATAQDRANRAGAWDGWEGKEEDSRRRRAAARLEETDSSRSRAWAEAAARALCRREQRFLSRWKEADGAAALEAFYGGLALQVEKDLAMSDGESRIWCEARANAALQALQAGQRPTDTTSALATRELVRLALKEDRDAA